MAKILGLLLLSLAVSAYGIPPLTREADEPLAEDYIVVFNHKARIDVSTMMDAVMSQMGVARTPLGAVAMNHCKREPRLGGSPLDCAGKVDMDLFKALTVTVKNDDPEALLALRSLPYVSYVAQSGVAHGVQQGSCSNQYTTTIWGIDAIDGSLNNYFNHDTAGGRGVDIYILDTGIDTGHTDFNGRASWGETFCQNQGAPCSLYSDVAGHGTHVAGTAFSTTYGVAKGASGYSVKVLNDANWGSWSGIIAGINWVAQRYQSNRRPSVMNLSISGGRYTACDNALAAAVATGVTSVVAAGNDNRDACNNSPAATTTAITVGNHNRNNQRRYDSNYGSCLDIWAPGDGILSTRTGGGTQTMSGTSMSSPHVAGAAAIYLGSNTNASPATVTSYLVRKSVTGLSDIKPGSPDRKMVLKCPLES